MAWRPMQPRLWCHGRLMGSALLRLGFLGALLLPLSASAVTMTLVSEETPYPGVTHRHYTTTSPTTHTWVTLIDLCTDRVHVTATRAPSSNQRTGAWAQDVGVQVATNGDFYRSGPQVYGDAVGRGIPWPVSQTGNASSASGEWFHERYGWIAMLADGVEFTHTRWVKNNASTFGGLSEGWMSGTIAPPAPPGVLGLVSGFPELIIEGQPITCSSATASSCFPDRPDMRDRHPRTAMGLTQDRETFILVAVDGRTSQSAGMYGLELVDVMDQLGAYVAFNLDGGGSSQMWLEDRGYANNQTGNNGGGTRSVANHWGVFAGTEGGRRVRPGHCASAAPCMVLPPEGGTVDNSDSCFQAFGPDQYWRSENSGTNGQLLWTNAWNTSLASNWAWWQLHFDEAGEYLVEIASHPTFGVFDQARYVVQADGAETELFIDQSAASDWVALGSFTFAAGGEQWVAVYDDGSGVGSDQHIVADAVRLTRLDLGDDDDSVADDDDAVDDDDSADDDDAVDDDDSADDDDSGDDGVTDVILEGERRPAFTPATGCGCATTDGGLAPVGLLGLLLALCGRRRRTSQLHGGASASTDPTPRAARPRRRDR